MAVPDTNTFSLTDVGDEIGLVSPYSLTDCFGAAEPTGFDGTYQPNGDGSLNNLLNFRNYTHVVATNDRYINNFGGNQSKTPPNYRTFLGVDEDFETVPVNIHTQEDIAGGSETTWYIPDNVGTHIDLPANSFRVKWSLTQQSGVQYVDKMNANLQPSAQFTAKWEWGFDLSSATFPSTVPVYDSPTIISGTALGNNGLYFAAIIFKRKAAATATAESLIMGVSTILKN